MNWQAFDAREPFLCPHSGREGAIERIMASATHQPPAAGLSTSEIAKMLGLTLVEQKQAQAAGPGPRKAPKPRQTFSVRSLLLYRDILKAPADALRGEDPFGGARTQLCSAARHCSSTQHDCAAPRRASSTPPKRWRASGRGCCRRCVPIPLCTSIKARIWSECPAIGAVTRRGQGLAEAAAAAAML